MKVTIQENQSTTFVNIDDVLTYTMMREGSAKEWHVRDMSKKVVAVSKYKNDLLSAVMHGKLEQYAPQSE